MKTKKEKEEINLDDLSIEATSKEVDLSKSSEEEIAAAKKEILDLVTKALDENTPFVFVTPDSSFMTGSGMDLMAIIYGFFHAADSRNLLSRPLNKFISEKLARTFGGAGMTGNGILSSLNSLRDSLERLRGEKKDSEGN